MKRPLTVLVVVCMGVVSSTLPCASHAAPYVTRDVAPGAASPLEAALKAHDGRFSAAAREAFLAASLLDLIARTNLPTSFWRWLESHEDIQDGLLCVQWPVPEQFAENLAFLKGKVTTRSADRYAHLLLAVALQKGDLQERFEHDQTPVTIVKERPRHVEQLADFIRTHNVTLAQIATEPERFHEEAGVPLPKKATQRNQLWEQVALEVGTYPSRQTAEIVATIRRLIRLHETPPDRVEGTWPRFSIVEAPWPLLLPLRQCYPLSESDFVWDRYANEGIFKTYGRYTWDYEKPEIMWKKSDFHPRSLQRVTEDGGVCGRLSVLAQQSYVAIGQPATGMYQPGHRAVLSYGGGIDGKPYTATLGQSIAGVQKTTSNWYLPDSQGWRFGKRCGVEHHMGLALSMNLGLDRWRDGRIALLVSRSLPDDRVDDKITLLESAMAISPFDIELIYEIAALHGDDHNAAQALIDRVKTLMGAPDSAWENDEELAADTDFNSRHESVMPSQKYRNRVVNQVCAVIKAHAQMAESDEAEPGDS